MLRPLLISFTGLLCLRGTLAFSSDAGGHPLHSPPRCHRAAVVARAAVRDEDVARPRSRRDFVVRTLAAGALALPTAPARADDGAPDAAAQGTIDPSVALPKITSKVYLEVQFAKYKTPKRLVIGLFGDAMPRTAENFRALCTNAEGPSYAGSTFYRVLSDMSIQGGAIGSATGKAGTSALDGGKPFAPDNFSILHTKVGLVSAVRGVNGEVDSRFFVQTEADAGWADGRYAAFGVVLEGEGDSGGMDLVRRISKVDVKPPQNSPKEAVTIVGCGILEG